MDGVELSGFGEGGWLDIAYATNHKVVTDFDHEQFKNYDSVNHRLKFVFVGSEPYSEGHLFPDNTNPTLTVENVEGLYNGGTEQGYITTATFCLSPALQSYEFEHGVYNTDYVNIKPDEGESLNPALINIAMTQTSNGSVVTKTLDSWMNTNPDNYNQVDDYYVIKISNNENIAIWNHVFISSFAPFNAEIIGV